MGAHQQLDTYGNLINIEDLPAQFFECAHRDWVTCVFYKGEWACVFMRVYVYTVFQINKYWLKLHGNN